MTETYETRREFYRKKILPFAEASEQYLQPEQQTELLNRVLAKNDEGKFVQTVEDSQLWKEFQRAVDIPWNMSRIKTRTHAITAWAQWGKPVYDPTDGFPLSVRGDNLSEIIVNVLHDANNNPRKPGAAYIVTEMHRRSYKALIVCEDVGAGKYGHIIIDARM